jgi:uncharacterized protein (DUF983 family)
MWGLLLRCPNCISGRMFRSMFEMYPVCPDCGVVFERDPGEVTGGIFINTVVALVLLLALLIALNVLAVPFTLQFIILGLSMVVFPILFYPCSRGLWVGILYVTGNVYRE